MDEILNQAIRIAKLAGNKIKELRESNQYSESLKFGYELVTTADLISQEIISNEISKLYPGHNFISEESESNDLSIVKPTWIVDPIDGTVGYANNQYQVAVSIAFAFDNIVKIGVVYNPFLDELFHAAEGFGAYLNNTPIKVKDVRSLSQCVVGTGFPHNRINVSEDIELLKNILPEVRDIRRLGSPALDICWVACGRLQGFYEGHLHPWDVAAAKRIAIEAGAAVGNYTSAKYDIPDCINGYGVILSSPGVFDELLRALTKSEIKQDKLFFTACRYE